MNPSIILWKHQVNLIRGVSIKLYSVSTSFYVCMVKYESKYNFMEIPSKFITWCSKKLYSVSSSFYVSMVKYESKYNFMETPSKFITWCFHKIILSFKFLLCFHGEI